jgi:hypothetical protein
LSYRDDDADQRLMSMYEANRFTLKGSQYLSYYTLRYRIRIRLSQFECTAAVHSHHKSRLTVSCTIRSRNHTRPGRSDLKLGDGFGEPTRRSITTYVGQVSPIGSISCLSEGGSD